MTAEGPSVVVLLAAHNGIPWLADQLDSIRDQNGVAVSIVVSDDASVDGTLAYLTSRPDVILLQGKAAFGSAGKNFFNLLARADLADHDYVALSDQDDLWHPWKLERAIGEIEARSCDGYSANVTAFWADGRATLVNKAKPQRKWDFLFEAAGPGCTYVLTAPLAREIQRALRATPRIAETVELHDWFVYAWARSHGYVWHIDPMPVLLYRQHSANVMGLNRGVRAASKRVRNVKSGWYRKQVETIAGLCGYQSNDFIRRILQPTWSGRMHLAHNTLSCRRDRSDALTLSLVALLQWF